MVFNYKMASTYTFMILDVNFSAGLFSIVEQIKANLLLQVGSPIAVGLV